MVSEMYNLMNSLDYSDTNSLSNIRKIVAKSVPVKAALGAVLETGNVQQKEAARFFNVLMDYYPVMMAFLAGKEKEIYPLILEMEPNLYQYLDRSRFPIVFYAEKDRQVIDYDIAAGIITQHYHNMGNGSLRMKRYKEAINYSKSVINSSHATTWMKMVSSSDLQISLRANGSPAEEILESFVRGIEFCRGLSPDEIAEIKKNVTVLDMADSVIKIGPLVTNANLRAKFVMSAVRNLKKIDTVRSIRLINSLSALKITSHYALNELYRQADSLNLKSVKAQVLNTWQTLKPSEDQRIASLPIVLEEVIKSGLANGEPLHSITGEPMASRYNSSPLKKSTLCLTGAIQCFISGYKNNVNGHQYTLWESVTAEENLSDLQGKIRPVYQEICGLIGMLNREKPIEYAFGDENYFSVKTGKDADINVSYYKNGNTQTDIILLQVKFTK